MPCDDLCLPDGQTCDHATIEFAPFLVAPYEIFKNSPHYSNAFTLDLDQDGKDEIFVVVTDSGLQTRRVRFNGTALEKVEDIEGNTIGYGDFDNKNGPDLIVTNTDNSLKVLKNKGDGTMEVAWKSTLPESLYGTRGGFVSLGQGKCGILLRDTFNEKFGLLAMDEQKGLSLVKEMEIPITSAGILPLVADVNQDGISDLVFRSKDGMETWLGTGSSFAFHHIFPDKYSYLVFLNKDPFPDLFHSFYDEQNKPHLYLYFGLPGGEYVKSEEPLPPITSVLWRILPGDFDGDGRTDLHVRLDHISEVWRGNGKGGFNYKVVSSPQEGPGDHLGASHLGDMNGDGLSDLVGLFDGGMSIRINITKKLP